LQPGQFFWELFLQVFFVFPEGSQVIVMKDDVGELGVKFIFVEILVDFLQIGEEGVFFQLEIDIAVSEPGLG
jgi:hypothetical protein